MIDWKDPTVVAYDFFLYEQIGIFLLGFYGTYFVKTLNIEWELLTRRRALRIVHLPYFIARYICLTALLFFDIQAQVNSWLACDVAYRLFASWGSLAAMSASCILCSRPAAIWWTLKCYPPLFLLAALALGQAVLVVLQGILTVRAKWDDTTQTCTLYKWDGTILAIFYTYTFGFDLVILALTLYAVRRVHREQKRKRWTVGTIVCIQGIGYVVATCIVNIPVAVLAILDLNVSMDVLLSLPAMTVSVMASSLALFSLDDVRSKHPVAGSTTSGSERPRTTITGSGTSGGPALTSVPAQLSSFSASTSQNPNPMAMISANSDGMADGDEDLSRVTISSQAEQTRTQRADDVHHRDITVDMV